MAKILEGVFVLGCAVVGLGMNLREAEFLNTSRTSIQLVNRVISLKSGARTVMSYNEAWHPRFRR